MSDDDLITYCGLYCGLCAERSLVPSKAHELRELVRDEGYDSFYELVPGMREHYPSFAKVLGDLSAMDCKCRDGSGGPPDCQIRSCATNRGKFVCMECEEHPCHKLGDVAREYPFLIADAARYRQLGKERWLEEQKGKLKRGFSYRMVRLTEPDRVGQGKEG